MENDLKNKIKISTGCVYKSQDFTEYDLLSYNLEISTLKTNRIKDNDFLFVNANKPYSWHLPDINPKYGFEHNFYNGPEYYVVHPHQDKYIEFLVYTYGIENRLHFENLDCRDEAKEYTHIGSKFLKLFDKYAEASACIDIAHLLSVEPNPKKAFDQIKHLCNKIKSLHVSTFDENKKHSMISSDWDGFYVINSIIEYNNCIPYLTMETPFIKKENIEKQIQLIVDNVKQ